MITLRRFLTLISNGCETFVKVDGKDVCDWYNFMDNTYVTDCYIDFHNDCIFVECTTNT